MLSKPGRVFLLPKMLVCFFQEGGTSTTSFEVRGKRLTRTSWMVKYLYMCQRHNILDTYDHPWSALDRLMTAASSGAASALDRLMTAASSGAALSDTSEPSVDAAKVVMNDSPNLKSIVAYMQMSSASQI